MLAPAGRDWPGGGNLGIDIETCVTPASAPNFAIIDLLDAYRVALESENFDFVGARVFT